MRAVLFRPDWPPPLITFVLALSGFFTSFQFAGFNAIAYADVEKERTSAATSFYATFQQLTLPLGICTAATVLELRTLVEGKDGPTLGSFSAAFVVVAVISTSAIIWNSRFAPDAGAAMSGSAAAIVHRENDNSAEDDRGHMPNLSSPNELGSN